MGKEETALTVIGSHDLSVLPKDTFDEQDFEGYSDSDITMATYISIRQKELRDDDSGKVISEAGGFKIHNSSFSSPPPDEKQILGVIVGSAMRARQYWKQGDDMPSCHSIDGVFGSEHGECMRCKYFPQGRKPKPDDCKSSPILLLAHQDLGLCVMRFTGSAVMPLNKYITSLNREGKKQGFTCLPPHAVATLFSTKYKAEPQPHYVPVLKVAMILDMKAINDMKDLREQAKRMIAQSRHEPDPDEV